MMLILLLLWIKNNAFYFGISKSIFSFQQIRKHKLKNTPYIYILFNVYKKLKVKRTMITTWKNNKTLRSMHGYACVYCWLVSVSQQLFKLCDKPLIHFTSICIGYISDITLAYIKYWSNIVLYIVLACTCYFPSLTGLCRGRAKCCHGVALAPPAQKDLNICLTYYYFLKTNCNNMLVIEYICKIMPHPKFLPIPGSAPGAINDICCFCKCTQ